MTEPMGKVYTFEDDYKLRIYRDANNNICCNICNYWTPDDSGHRQLNSVIFAATRKTTEEAITDLKNAKSFYDFMFDTAISAVEREGL